MFVSLHIYSIILTLCVKQYEGLCQREGPPCQAIPWNERTKDTLITHHTLFFLLSHYKIIVQWYGNRVANTSALLPHPKNS